MSDQFVRPDVGAVLLDLKNFQLDTVEYVFKRLYLDPEDDLAYKFLIADEVGLGKTLVARGLIAKVINHLWDSEKRIDIIYICSNSELARQNLRRLAIPGLHTFRLASRVTLLPLTVHDLKANKVNFISITPDTSFIVDSRLGKIEERALLYRLLDRAWSIRSNKGAFAVLQGTASDSSFQAQIKGKSGVRIDEDLQAKFIYALGAADLRNRFDDTCARFARARRPENADHDDRSMRNRLVGDLRKLLAKICLEALEPDLIILDEFQRFKQLLSPTNEAGELAENLFEYVGERSRARVLLLSATPYKMYTMQYEQERDSDRDGISENHYEDFARTLDFLAPRRKQEFEPLLHLYQDSLAKLASGDTESIIASKQALERELRKVMVRTERLATKDNRGGMLEEVACQDCMLTSSDVSAYLDLQRTAGILKQNDTLEYWKSAPYLLSFMDEYELKRSFRSSVDPGLPAVELAKVVSQSEGLALPWESISAYEGIDPANPRMRYLASTALSSGAWRLLWTPPALPYYEPSGPYAGAALWGLTKRLVFSSWKVAPKAISALLSYEAERAMITSFESRADYSPEARKRRRPLLRFTQSEDRPTGMPVLAMLYPSVTLAKECDPLSIALGLSDHGRTPSEAEVLRSVKAKIQQLLEPILRRADVSTSGAEDETWYWAAPILLDMQYDESETRIWFSESSGPRDPWGANLDRGDGEDQTGLAIHMKEVRKHIHNWPRHLSLKKPPADLPDLLALMALGGPGNVALRALRRVSGERWYDLREHAAKVGWGFRSLFNVPEVMSMIRGLTREEPYWRRVLEYCVDGNLQATLDEYCHLLRESLGLMGESAKNIAAKISSVVTLRTARVGADDIKANAETGTISRNSFNMRVRFAMPFGDARSDEGEDATRLELVRDAFNSPFWPFVLTTTSVGQEGLDFHLYCHAVVHWNLPSNPVDLEQREGRVHRYKGHAIRKNLAKHYGLATLKATAFSDPWAALFSAGSRDTTDSLELEPFWTFQTEGGAFIERQVPALPFSRDKARYEALLRKLTVYRMVFGQPHQEGLVADILSQVPPQSIDEMRAKMLINLEPPHPMRDDK